MHWFFLYIVLHDTHTVQNTNNHNYSLNLFRDHLHMYEIATLKEKKLADLQEIAKKLGLKKISALKKLDLIYQIIDYVSANPPEQKRSPEKAEAQPASN